ncbi:MAG: zinc dependent phospholipase C family protein [Bellilinea sp.]
MGTWICHLRVAEKITNSLPNLNFPAFYAGSIAPDCGMPDETWTNFDPPKTVTHYLVQGESNNHIQDLDFYHAYKSGLDSPLASSDASFLWGYYFHLVTDALWVELIDPATKYVWAHLFVEDKFKAIDLIKDDWYGLDHRFLRSNPGWEPWKIFYQLELPPIPIDHIPANAINFQFDYIRKYYSEVNAGRILDRPFPYLNEATMQRVVRDSAAASLKIYHLLRNNVELNGAFSAISLLSAEERLPYPPPLGDT